MKLLPLICCLFSLSALADDQPKEGVDGYYIEATPITRYEFYLKVHVVKDEVELHDMQMKIFGVYGGLGLKGFTIINEGTDQCEIYIVDPKILYEPEFLGHELTHCIYGTFHDSQHRERHLGPFWHGDI